MVSESGSTGRTAHQPTTAPPPGLLVGLGSATGPVIGPSLATALVIGPGPGPAPTEALTLFQALV